MVLLCSREVIHTLLRLQFSGGPRIHLHSSSSSNLTFQEVDGEKAKVQKNSRRFFVRKLNVFRLRQLLPVCQTEGEGSSSHPLQGEETAAVRAVREFRSMTCFCFYSGQDLGKAQGVSPATCRRKYTFVGRLWSLKDMVTSATLSPMSFENFAELEQTDS